LIFVFYFLEHVLNVCDWDTNKIIQDNFNVIHIPMSDDCDTNIRQHFDRTNKLLHEIYEQKQRCLVHCAAGK
jgi:protein-tyrosine phosphatase